MTRTIYLSVRGDGSWRLLEAFRRSLGQEAEALVVHANRDESGFYGSADVSDPNAAREAFVAARQQFPGLKAYCGGAAPEHEDPPRQVARRRVDPAEREQGGERSQRRRPLRQRGRGSERQAEHRATNGERQPERRLANDERHGANGERRKPR